MSNNTLKILAVGDIFLADSPLNIGNGVKSNINKKGQSYYIDQIKTITEGYDICFGNLECVLSNKNYNKYDISKVEVRGESEFATILCETGFNILNIANNHMFQHGLDAYIDTVNNLTKANIKVIGDELFGRNFEVFEHGDNVVGIAGFSLHYEQYRPDEACPYALREEYEEICSDIKKIRANFNCLLICSLHWGYEYLSIISLEQRDFCHRLVDIGVDIILGHHTHVAQGIEEYKGGLIVYSLGNFVFDMETPETRKSFALEVVVSNKRIFSYKLTPIFICDDGCPNVIIGTEAEEFIDNIMTLSKEIESGVCLHDYDLKKLQENANSNIKNRNYRVFFNKIFTMNIYYYLMIIARALLRRLRILPNP